jgi:hypothetical protein
MLSSKAAGKLPFMTSSPITNENPDPLDRFHPLTRVIEA